LEIGIHDFLRLREINLEGRFLVRYYRYIESSEANVPALKGPLNFHKYEGRVEKSFGNAYSESSVCQNDRIGDLKLRICLICQSEGDDSTLPT
jgi:hypothetical protein